MPNTSESEYTERVIEGGADCDNAGLHGFQDLRDPGQEIATPPGIPVLIECYVPATNTSFRVAVTTRL